MAARSNHPYFRRCNMSHAEIAALHVSGTHPEIGMGIGGLVNAVHDLQKRVQDLEQELAAEKKRKG